MLREAQTQRIRLSRPVVLAAAILMLAGTVWVGNTIASDPNVKAAQAVAVDTLVLEHTFGDPDVAHPKFTKADVPRLRFQADALARSHYIGTLLATRIRDFLNVVDVMESGELTLIDGGVKRRQFHQYGRQRRYRHGCPEGHRLVVGLNEGRPNRKPNEHERVDLEAGQGWSTMVHHRSGL